MTRRPVYNTDIAAIFDEIADYLETDCTVALKKLQDRIPGDSKENFLVSDPNQL